MLNASFMTIGILLKVTDKECTGSNPQFDKITENLKYIVKAGSQTKIPSSKRQNHISHDPKHFVVSINFSIQLILDEAPKSRKKKQTLPKILFYSPIFYFGAHFSKTNEL